MLRDLLNVAREARANTVAADHALRLAEVYAICYRLARELKGRYADVRIMVGDLATDNGMVPHHWLEIPSRGAYVDAAYDALDSFQPVRAGKLDDPDFASTHPNGVDANIDVQDPRNRPNVL
jgi:streptomycin 6-kinase